MRMMEAFQDMDLGVQILFELFIQLLEVNGFDRYIAASLLFPKVLVSIDSTPSTS